MLELGEGGGDPLEDSEGDGEGERRRVDELDELDRRRVLDERRRLELLEHRAEQDSPRWSAQQSESCPVQ